MYSNVAKPDWTLDHTIDFNNAEIIDKGKDAGILAHSENRRGRQQLMPFTRTTVRRVLLTSSMLQKN